MKSLLSIVCMAFCLCSLGENPENNRSILRFNKDGKFKIAQLTDIHISSRDKKSSMVPDTLLAVLAIEKPDLVVMTGDIVTKRPAAEGWKMITEMMRRANIPYVVTMGNHDAQVMSRDEIYDILAAEPLFIGEKGPQELSGVGNFVLPIFASADSTHVQSVLYCLDSGDYADNEENGTYAWIKWDQIGWYRSQSQEYTRLNDGEPLPALAFFHIALPEYRNINEANKNVYGCSKEGPGVGAPEVNSGFLLSCIEMGDVMGTFVGHDHDNDYIGMQNGIALAYGRVSGFNAYGDLARGARIVELTEGKRQFDTWITTPKGRELMFSYPLGITDEDLKRPYLQSQEVTPQKQGVSYAYYEGNYKKIADVPHIGKMVKEGSMSNFFVNGAPAINHYAYEFRTYIQIPEREIYFFKVKSDDGAQLFIDGQLVVDNGDGHSMSDYKRGKVGLEKGFHEMRVVYYEDYMGQGLEISIESRKMKEQRIPDQMLFLP